MQINSEAVIQTYILKNLQYGSSVMVLLMVDVLPRSSVAWHDMIVPLSNFVILLIVNLLLMDSPLVFPIKLYNKYEGKYPGQRWTIEVQVRVMLSPTNGCSGWMLNVGLTGFAEMFMEEQSKIHKIIYLFIKYYVVILCFKIL